MEGHPSRKRAHLILQQALAEPMGLLIWTNEPLEFTRILSAARREDPILQALKILNTPEGVAICHEPNDFQLEDHHEPEEY